MQALGLIETKGLLAAIECADAMLKAAEVHLIEKTYVGGGLVTIIIEGDVAATKAAVEAGAAAVRQLDNALLISEHVIPRPHQELDSVILSGGGQPEFSQPDETESTESEDVVEEERVEVTAAADEAIEEDAENLHKAAVDQIAVKKGVETVIAVLKELKVVKLRNLAREYKDFGITGRSISKADKQAILEEFKKYYVKN